MNTIEQATAPAKVARPAGLEFIAGLNIIGGVTMIIRVFTNGYSSNVAGIWLIVGLLSIVVEVGLLSRQRWALVVAIGGYSVNILVGLASQNPIAVIVPAAILYYLCTEKVRAVFAPPAPPALPHETDAKEA